MRFVSVRPSRPSEKPELATDGELQIRLPQEASDETLGDPLVRSCVQIRDHDR